MLLQEPLSLKKPAEERSRRDQGGRAGEAGIANKDRLVEVEKAVGKEAELSIEEGFGEVIVG